MQPLSPVPQNTDMYDYTIDNSPMLRFRFFIFLILRILKWHYNSKLKFPLFKHLFIAHTQI